MSRPKGAPNKLTVEKHRAAQQLSETFGDPVADMLQRRNELIAERSTLLALRTELLAEPSRHRKIRKLGQTEAAIDKLDTKILAHNEACANFVRPKYQAIAQTTEVTVSSVIRAPETVANTKKWLKKYGPKTIDTTPVQIEAPKQQVPIEKFVANTKAALHIADAIGAGDAQTVIDEARRAPDNFIAEWDRKFLTGY